MSLRRPDFKGGRSIKLADGQEWTIPVPEKFYRFAATSLGFTQFHKINGQLSPEFDAVWDAYEKSLDGVDLDFIRGSFQLMRFMLGLNYDLTDDQASELLEVTFSPDKNDPIREAFLAAARAIEVPKEVTDAGSILL